MVPTCLEFSASKRITKRLFIPVVTVSHKSTLLSCLVGLWIMTLSPRDWIAWSIRNFSFSLLEWLQSKPVRFNKIVASLKYLAPLLRDHLSRPYASRHINSLVMNRTREAKARLSGGHWHVITHVKVFGTRTALTVEKGIYMASSLYSGGNQRAHPNPENAVSIKINITK